MRWLLDTFLADQEEWGDFKRSRPSDSKIKQYYRRAVELWDTIQDNFPAVKTVAESDKGEEAARDFRGPQGGHLLFRPAGLLLIIDVIRTLMEQEVSLRATVERLAEAPMELQRDPWAGLLWDTVNRRMITPPENRKVAMRILYYGIGGDLDTLGTSAQDLRTEWAGIVLQKPSEVRLRRWAR